MKWYITTPLLLLYEVMINTTADSAIGLTETQKQIVEITRDLKIAGMSDYLSKMKISRRGTGKALEKLVATKVLEKMGELKGAKYRIKS